jgi:glycosyltransferase involved in cell wall biosynthesis
VKVVLAQNVSLRKHLGLSTYLMNAVKSLSGQKNVELHMIIQGPNELPPELKKEQVHELESNTYSIVANLKYSLKMLKVLRELDRQGPIDIIHCIYPFSSILGAVLFKRLFKPEVKIVYDIRSPWIENSVPRLSFKKGVDLYKKTAYFVEKMLVKQVDGFIFITRELRDLYREWLRLPFSDSILIPSGIDLEHFTRKDSPVARTAYGLDDEHFLVGYVGVLSREREMDFVIKAFHEVLEHDDTCRLMIVGDGADRTRLVNLTRKMNMEGYVYFTGSVDHDEVPDYISGFNLGLCHLPDNISFRHSFPMKVLEYSSCGTHVAVSNIQAHKEIAEEVPLTLYEVDDTSDLSKKILGEKERSDRTNNCNLERFSWQNIAERIADFYQEVQV